MSREYKYQIDEDENGKLACCNRCCQPAPVAEFGRHDPDDDNAKQWLCEFCAETLWAYPGEMREIKEHINKVANIMLDKITGRRPDAKG